MCGRFTLTADPAEVGARFEAKLTEALERATGRFNVAPSQEVLTVVREREAPVPEPKLLRWGLVPAWADDLKVGYKMINARDDRIDRSPAYRGLVGKGTHRCLIVADGYYEWVKAEDPKAPKQPMLFTLDGGAVFSFAGLWTRSSVDGDEVESCTIVTTDANAIVKPIHGRMPFILPGAEAEAAWLDPGVELDGALSLLAEPGDPGRYDVRPVHTDVNKARNEGPDLHRPPERAAAG